MLTVDYKQGDSLLSNLTVCLLNQQWWASYFYKVTEFFLLPLLAKELATFNPLPVFPVTVPLQLLVSAILNLTKSLQLLVTVILNVMRSLLVTT
jgi:hypothetical protein